MDKIIGWRIAFLFLIFIITRYAIDDFTPENITLDLVTLSFIYFYALLTALVSFILHKKIGIRFTVVFLIIIPILVEVVLTYLSLLPVEIYENILNVTIYFSFLGIFYPGNDVWKYRSKIDYIFLLTIILLIVLIWFIWGFKDFPR